MANVTTILGRNLRRKGLAIITVFLAASLISALLAVSIDIGDKMSRSSNPTAQTS